jgi:hypothetical protein
MGQSGFTQQVTKLLAVRSLHDMVVSGSFVYLVGGSNNATGTAAGGIANIDRATILPDGTLSDFKTVAYLPAARVQGDTIVAGGYLIMLGGQDTSAVSQNQIYVAKIDGNGGLAPFKTITTFPKATMIGHRLVFAKGFLYVIGGGAANNQEVYFAKMFTDGSFGVWTKTVDLPAALSFHAAVTNEGGDAIFVSGGIVGTTVQDTIYRAFVNGDGTLSKWQFAGSMISPRWRHGALIHKEQLFELGGSPDNVANSSLASCGFAKINTDWSLGKSVQTGALWTTLRNVEVALAPFTAHGKIAVCGGHLSSGNANDAINLASIQSDGHI